MYQVPRPDFDLQFYQLLMGEQPRAFSMQIGSIPLAVSQSLGWKTTRVLLSSADAEKIRHHPQHGMIVDEARKILPTIERGDYYQQGSRGSPLEICVVLHDPYAARAGYFLVLARDADDSEIRYRTFFRNTKLQKQKFNRGKQLLNQSGLDWFAL